MLVSPLAQAPEPYVSLWATWGFGGSASTAVRSRFLNTVAGGRPR